MQTKSSLQNSLSWRNDGFRRRGDVADAKVYSCIRWGGAARRSQKADVTAEMGFCNELKVFFPLAHAANPQKPTPRQYLPHFVDVVPWVLRATGLRWECTAATAQSVERPVEMRYTGSERITMQPPQPLLHRSPERNRQEAERLLRCLERYLRNARSRAERIALDAIRAHLHQKP